MLCAIQIMQNVHKNAVEGHFIKRIVIVVALCYNKEKDVEETIWKISF